MLGRKRVEKNKCPYCERPLIKKAYKNEYATTCGRHACRIESIKEWNKKNNFRKLYPNSTVREARLKHKNKRAMCLL